MFEVLPKVEHSSTLSAEKKTPECSAWKRRSHLKQLKKFAKKNALVDKRPNLYLIQRFLCIPLEEAHVPHFENHWSRMYYLSIMMP